MLAHNTLIVVGTPSIQYTYPSDEGAEENLEHREHRQHDNLGQALPGVSKRGGHVDEQQAGLEHEDDQLRQRADRVLFLIVFCIEKKRKREMEKLVLWKTKQDAETRT